MRERLIELICENIQDECIRHCNHPYCDKCKILADYLLENGVIVPPCKVGDTVYQVDTLFKEIIITELKVVELTIDNKGIKTLYGATNRGSVYSFDRNYNLDQIKFTKEAAENALKERERG